MKYELLQMQKQGYGNIVNTSSISGLIGRAGDMPYNVSKHGIIGLTKTAALENADMNIRINCVCPGATKTSWVKRITTYEQNRSARRSGKRGCLAVFG